MKQQANSASVAVLDEMIEEDLKSYDKLFYPILQEAKSRIQALGDGETLEDIIEDIGKRMCHAGLLYPNAGYWTLQDKWGWECKGETLIEVYKEFREELKRNGHYD